MDKSVSSAIGWIGDAEHASRSPADAREPHAAQVNVPGMWALGAGGLAAPRTSLSPAVAAFALGEPRLEVDPRTTVPGDALERIAVRFGEIGIDVLREVRGPFVLALYDRRRRAGLIAVDRMGICAAFVCASHDGIAFGESPVEVARAAGRRVEVSPQALFDYLFSHVVPAPHSIVTGVRRLLPGECALYENGRCEYRRYWRASFVEDRPAPFGALKAEFRSALRDSVAAAVAGASAGAFLSGGTDSSTIVGMMREVTGDAPRAFSIGFDAPGYDEMEFARAAARHFGAQHHEYYMTAADVVASAPLLARVHTQPFGNSSGAPTYFCARNARERGCDVILGGDGGDELFGGNARYALQHVFSLYGRLPEALRRSVIEPVAARIRRLGRIPLLSGAAGFVQQASIPMPARLESYNLLTRIGCEEVLHEDLLRSVDSEEPVRLLESEYFNPTASSLINRMLALDLKTTLGDNDLPKVTRSCVLAGVNVRFPMLDERVVDFSLALEPAQKLRGTRLRYFFKQALRDFLPAETIGKKKHGFGLPFGRWALSDPQLRALTFDSLADLKRRRIVRAAFIDRLEKQLMPLHPAYYGTLAWVLMMLELWMRQHLDASARPARTAAESC